MYYNCQKELGLALWRHHAMWYFGVTHSR